MDVFVARQPIFDEEYNVFAYELLYRDSELNYFDGSVADNVATSILLTNSYFTFGIENLIGEHKAFINFDKHLLTIGVAELLDKEKVVIEILENVVPDEQLIKSLNKLSIMGYTLAIDDYTVNYKYPEITKYCDIIKIDFIENSKEEIKALAQKFKDKDKLLLGEKIETKEEYEWAKELGFNFYQGYYFARPKLEKKKNASENVCQYVRLMNELNQKDPNFKRLSEIVLSDVTLTYKLLKIVNSNARVKSEVKSIRQAISILGIREFRKWLSLAMVQNLENSTTNEAVKQAIIRSQMLRKIAERSRLRNSVYELELVGILSVVDVVFESTMEDILINIPITRDVKDTLLRKKSKYSDALEICLSYEKGEFDRIDSLAENIDYNPNLIVKNYLDSLKWAEKLIEELKI